MRESVSLWTGAFAPEPPVLRLGSDDRVFRLERVDVGVGRVDLSRQNKQIAEPGMAMIVHPNQYFPDLGYVALGQMVIVTETGTERLSRLQPDIYERT